jgi:membrane protein DedA with SNARE-associated domain
METLTQLLETHGYALLFALGFAEFAGLPIASGAILVLAGSFAAHGALDLPRAAASAAAGGLLADAIWYGVARRHGPFVLGVACGLATEPGACVLGARDRVARFGARSVVFAKLVPGMANLAAPSAGLARVPALRFLIADSVGLALWALIGTGLGWIFADRVELAIQWGVTYARIALGVGAFLILAAVALRLAKLRRHRAAHARATAEIAPAAPARSGRSG